MATSHLANEDSSDAQNTIGQRLLTRSFKLIELEYLQQNPQFQKAVVEMQTLDAFENVTILGHRLLLDRDERGNPTLNILKQDFS